MTQLLLMSCLIFGLTALMFVLSNHVGKPVLVLVAVFGCLVCFEGGYASVKTLDYEHQKAVIEYRDMYVPAWK